MPEKETLRRASQDKRDGEAASTQAGEFVREEMEHIREGKHGARSTKQAIAIGLSKARRAGVHIGAPPSWSKATTKRSAKSARREAARQRKTSPRRSRATRKALRREGHRAASRKALAKQARSAAHRRTMAARRASARQAVRTRKRRARVHA